MSNALSLKYKRDAEHRAAMARLAHEEELRLLDVPRPSLTPLAVVDRMIEITTPTAAMPQAQVAVDPNQAPAVAPAPALADRWMAIVESGDYTFNRHEQALYDLCQRQTGETAK